MAYISKHLFDEKISNLSCKQLIHRSTENCTRAWFDFVIQCFGGIAAFFFLMYSAQHIVMRKELTESNIKQMLKDYSRSLSYGYILALTFITSNCIQFKLLGKLDYYITSYGTGIAMGLTSTLSPKSRMPIEASYFSILALECLIRYLTFTKLLPRSKTYGALYFILSNSLMMYLLWTKMNKDNALKINWLFKPYSKRTENSHGLCHHPGTCVNDCIKESGKYFLISLGLTITKLIIKWFNNSTKNMLNLLKLDYFREPLFFWAYVALHKAVYCSLTIWRGEDNSTHSIVAGLISSLSYLIKPNLTIPASQTILIIMALFDKLKENYEVPKLPYQYLCYSMSTAILIHFSFVNPKLIPNFFRAMLSKASAGRSDKIFQRLQCLVFL